jgi:cytochrome c
MARLSSLVLLGPALLLSGCKVSRPGTVEQHVMVAVKHHITVRNKSEKIPLPFNAENLAAGKEAFGHYCTVCHGMDGQNTGVPFADHLSPPPPLLTSADVQGYTDGQLKWVLDNGISPSGMPASKGILSDEELWSIVLYIRHLPPAGSVGEPEVYSH